MKINHIHHGEALETLKTFPDESIDCCITSPPYYGLRDYGIEYQLGLEKTHEEYIDKLCRIFDEVKRVLKKEGTCWVVLGDTYSNNRSECNKVQGNPEFNKGRPSRSLTKIPKLTCSLPTKSLCMIPERFAIEMIDRGWILRNQIIWQKPNAMPCSASDRFTVDFEKVFFFVKNKKYNFKTLRDPHKEESIKRACRTKSSKGSAYGIQVDAKNTGYQNMMERLKKGELRHGAHPDGRNKRTTWTINTQAYMGAHFAVFPEALIEPMIEAGCPKGGIVLDPFAGSGTTGLVAYKSNKKFVGIELNSEYIGIANKRLNGWKQQTRLIV